MYDYGADTLGMWGGEPSVRADPTSSLAAASASAASSPASIASAALARRPEDAATIDQEWSVVAAQQQAKYEEESRQLALQRQADGEKVSYAQEETASLHQEEKERQDWIRNSSKGDGNFEAMKSAAIAAGIAQSAAARRGSQIHLLSANQKKTTSLLFRRPSSLERELEQAKAIHEENRRQHFEQRLPTGHSMCRSSI